MSRKHQYKFLIIIGILILYTCDNTKAKTSATIEKKEYPSQDNEVDVMVLNKTVFKKELVSNGRLSAQRKSQLKFNVSEKLQNIYVKNGDYVKKGQVLASLNAFTYQQKVNKAKIDLKQATLEFNDLKIRRGFDSIDIDASSMKEQDMIAIKSGYKNALHELENAEFELKSTKLIAPFNGKIANIESKQHDYISSGKELLTLINDAIFEVEFYIIESELKDIKVNDKITLQPFALNQTYEGNIVTINPQVEKDGTILVKAQVKNNGDLLEGMNVKVFIQKDIPKQFVVPKASIVLRDNQEVLFKVQQGKAYWTYVQSIYENSKSYAVIPHPNKSSATLSVGDTIITSNNLNLAHDSAISIKQEH